MKYYEDDLRTGLPDRLNDPEKLNPSAIDTAQHQHMVTFGVAFGVKGDLDPDDYNDNPASPDFMKCINSANCIVGQYPDWPGSIGIRSKATVDDLFHATVNGRGDFLTAKDPEELADSLLELMNNILARLGSASAVSINGDSLYGKVSDDVLMFQASYKTNDWSGDVKAYEVDTTTGRVLLDNPKWSAADSLATIAWGSRNILTYDGSSGAEFDPAESSIAWDASLGSDYANIINFVRGQEDISGFRVRNSLLGDIVHSSPVFEEDFVYVGANDGMLHAFEINVTTVSGTKLVSGQEKFAYVPSFVFENLVNLTETAMVHKFFVDLTPTIVSGEGLLGGSGDETILVGGLGKGGKGYFALDITDPANMGTDDVLWEFPNDATSSEVSDMGYSFSKPVVVQTNSTTASEAWVVITGNGYDSPDGRAVLYILNPLSGEVTRKIPTLVSDSDNGLSSPIAVDVNYDRKVDFVYAGDLKGNMWKFDLTGDNSSKWSVAYYGGTPIPTNQPLFQAIDPSGFPQPITSKPEVMFHPRKHGLLVLFGTGKFLGMSDFSDDRVQTVYGIWDYGDRIYYPGAWGAYSNDDDTEYLGAFNRPKNLSNFPGKDVELLEQTSTTYPVTIVNINNQTVNTDIRVLSDNTPNWYTVPDLDPLGTNGNPNLDDLAEDPLQTAHGGWFWDLPLSGERVVTDVLLRDGRLVVICFTPNPDRCSDGGSSFLMELNSFTGGTSGGTIFDINNDGRIDGDDWVKIGVDDDGNDIKAIPDGLKLEGMVQQPAILILDPEVEIKYLSSSTGAVHMVKEKAVRLGVTYWKELEK
jgi:type IV pilus assembly protein PilY1